MNKHSVTIALLAICALLVPAAAAQAGPAKSKMRFSATSYAVAENAGTATIDVTRSARNGKSKSATGSSVSVSYATSDGTAVAGTDYLATSGRLTFPACGSNPAANDPCLDQHIQVAISDDNVVNGNRTVRLALTSPSRNAVVVNPQKTTLTIADNEGPTHLTFDAASYTVWELGPAVEVHVIRSGAGISGATSVDFATANGSATAPGDYSTTNATLNYGAGEVDKTVLVPISDDSVVEPTESFSVALANASGGATIDALSESVTILDDDTVTNAHVGFDVTSYSVGEGGDVTITVNRTASIDSPVTVDYATVAQTATADVDYVAAGDTLSFDPGDTSQSFTVSTLPDTLHEGDETFGLMLQNQVPSGTVLDTTSTTVTISDDDPAPTISAGAGTVNSDGTVTFQIDLSNPTTSPVTVDYTIQDANGNTIASGTATIPPGSSGTTVTVPIPAGDGGPWSITLTNPTGGTIDPVGSTSSTPLPGGGGGTGSSGGADTSGGTTTAGDPTATTSSTGSATGSSTQSGSTTSGGSTTTKRTAASTRDEAVLLASLDACGLTVRSARRVDSHGRLIVRLHAGRACTVVLGANVRGSGRKPAATRVLRALKTGRSTVALKRGQSRTLALRFSKRGLGFIKRALAAHRRVTLTVAVVEHDARKRVSKRTLRTRLHR